MSTLKLRIEADIIVAMKAKDVITRDTLRVVKGEVERNEDANTKLTDSDIVRLIKKQIESINEMKSDNGEVAVLEKYLPSQMSEAEITAVVLERKEIEGLTVKDMGKVMQYFKANHDGVYDGKLLSEIVKKTLV